VSNPSDRKYTATHEWIRDNGDGTVTVGITDHAQEALGELVYVELPQAGRTVAAGEACAVVESTKAASDVYAPLAGKVVGGNDALAGEPQLVNSAPFEGGWLFRLQPADPSALAALMSAADYDRSSAA
jgi:glycine cleavage system H protein